MAGNSDETEGSDKSSSSAQKRRQVNNSLNPTRSYFYFLAATVLSYSVLFLFGYFALILLMLYFVIFVFHEASYILANLSYGLARKAALVNSAISLGFFLILAVNGFAIARYGFPFILPEIANFTVICPVFIIMSSYGCRNVRLMYGP